jgi:hypothetical protein
MMIRTFLLSMAVSLATMNVAVAQQPPANPNAPSNPAVTTPSTPSAATPAPGANSFTEAQAKTRLENQGFTAVGGLTKDKDGIWRGMATKGGRTANVGVDYQGNVVEN